jgi:predicted O-methyltransferase YrrM
MFGMNLTNKLNNENPPQEIESFIQKDQAVILENLHILDSVKNKPSFEEFEFVFVDCDKICYPELLSLLSLKLKPGSVLVFDNVLWHGRLQKDIHTRPSDHSIQTFWDLVLTNFSNRTLFPVGDGLLLLRI